MVLPELILPYTKAVCLTLLVYLFSTSTFCIHQGFKLLPGEHPIVPVMLNDAVLASQFAAKMLEQGVYVVAFSFPVVAKGKARIRTQMSAAHSRDDLEFALEAFARVKKQLGL